MRHWVFDLDGTLVDSFAPYFKILDELFSAQGKEFHPDLRLPAISERIPAFLEKHLGKAHAPKAIEKIRTQSNQDALRIRMFEGVADCLQHLAEERNARIAIWTSRDRESAELILEATGLRSRAEVFVSGTCTTEHKPHPEGLLRIIDAFGCDPSTVTMVGDHEYDVLAAKKAGARAIRASWHSYWSVEPCTQADFQFHQISAFSEWLRKDRVSRT